MEQLLLLLGTGQGVLRNFDKREYKTAKYFLKSDRLKLTIESPFVGEAIVKLHPNRFSKIYIMGTNSSIWETLYMHINRNETNPDKLEVIKHYFYKLWDLTSKKELSKNKEVIDELNKSLTDYFNIPTECVIIPVGETEEELWQIFEILFSLKIENTIVSFDLTHGLRYQPFFLLFTLFYLNSVSDGKVKFGSVFYGALELVNDPKYKGIAPIFEFNVFSELHNWISAAEVLRKYKDPEQIAILLEKYDHLKKLSESLKKISFSYNANVFSDIIRFSKLLTEQIEDNEDYPKPFNLISPKIIDFANEINLQKSETKKYLKIAQHQLRYHNYSQSIIALYEAVIIEFMNQKNIKNKVEGHKTFKSSLNNLRSSIINNNIKDFTTNLNILKNIRNAIAHLDETGNNEKINIEEIRDLINYFSSNLEKARFS